MQPFHELSISYLTLFYWEELWGLTAKSPILIHNFFTSALSSSHDSFWAFSCACSTPSQTIQPSNQMLNFTSLGQNKPWCFASPVMQLSWFLWITAVAFPEVGPVWAHPSWTPGIWHQLSPKWNFRNISHNAINTSLLLTSFDGSV